MSPNDLVYIPLEDEKENLSQLNFDKLSQEQVARIFKVVSFTGNRLYAVPNNIAISIVDKMEFTLLNKLEFTIDKKSIKEFCLKLELDRLGTVKKIIR